MGTNRPASPRPPASSCLSSLMRIPQKIVRNRIGRVTSREVVERHKSAGRFFDAGKIRSFVREDGDGDPVVLVHGVPASSFLYRKVIDELAARGFRGIAFDLPGLGLADRPRDFDYSWTGLGRFATATLDALELDRVHLVGHDIGAPVAFELTALRPGRVASLTVLNAPVAVGSFRRPVIMKPFAVPWLGSAYLDAVTPTLFRRLMR